MIHSDHDSQIYFVRLLNIRRERYLFVDRDSSMSAY